jgi:hypothetical protein
LFGRKNEPFFIFAQLSFFSFFLQFVTGTSRGPVTGFRDLQGSQGPKRFTLELVASMEPGALPKAKQQQQQQKKTTTTKNNFCHFNGILPANANSFSPDLTCASRRTHASTGLTWPHTHRKSRFALANRRNGRHVALLWPRLLIFLSFLI